MEEGEGEEVILRSAWNKFKGISTEEEEKEKEKKEKETHGKERQGIGEHEDNLSLKELRNISGSSKVSCSAKNKLFFFKIHNNMHSFPLEKSNYTNEVQSHLIRIIGVLPYLRKKFSFSLTKRSQ